MTTRPELSGDFGMVGSTHWLASAVGMAMLERGGNAFDAAVAAGFTLQVVEPHLNGPAGEVPMLIATAGSSDVQVVAGQGPAPAAATPQRFADLGLDLVPGTGHLAATVPGSFDAWLTLLERFGTMPLDVVLAPAIGYARRGYPVLPSITRTITAVEQLFRDHWVTSAAVYLPDGRVPEPGSLLTNPVLADTYERLSDIARSSANRESGIAAARDEFYRGSIAAEIDAFVRQPAMDTSGTPHAGLLTADDLASWRTPLEAPATLDIGPYRVAKTGAWGQGPVLLQQLALLAGFDLADTGPADPQLVHTVLECAKLAFADREAWYGDVDDVPLATLLSAAYADERRALVDDTASGELRPGRPDGREPRLAEFATGAGQAGTGEPTLDAEPAVDSRGNTRGDTCHVDVVDRFGNMVSATPSGGWLQSSPVIPSLGFGLGTRAQMFTVTAGLPNSVAPGKRPRTTLSPSLALRDGVPYLAFGTPGGDQQDQWQLQFWLFHTAFGLNLQEAIDAATWHSTHFPSSFFPRDSQPRGAVVEDRLGADAVAQLRRRGHDVTVVGGWTLGRLSAVSRTPDGRLRAGANPRGAQGYAAGALMRGLPGVPLTAQDYFETALTVLGDHGSDALTIAVLCERLEITKGSFYHHFGSMSGFVAGLLEHWEREHSDRLIEASQREPDPGLRILTLTEFALTLPHAPEAAIRAWAHSNDVVAQAVTRVDARRDDAISEAIAGLGVAPERAQTFSTLAMTLLIGIQSRDRNPDPARMRELFDEVIRLVFSEVDPARLAKVQAALGL